MAVTRTKPLAYNIEAILCNYLKKTGAFKGCAVVAHSDGNEAPEELPCIVIRCPNTTRTDETPDSMYAKDANVTCVLYVDSEETTQGAMECYAAELELRMEDLIAMQKTFNKPSSGRDYRKIRGVHLHYLSEFQTDQETDGTEWHFGVGCTLMVQETINQ